jgi:hypothetical protein
VRPPFVSLAASFWIFELGAVLLALRGGFLLVLKQWGGKVWLGKVWKFEVFCQLAQRKRKKEKILLSNHRRFLRSHDIVIVVRR